MFARLSSSSMRYVRNAAFAALSVAVLSTAASASTITIVNGGFETTTFGGGQLGYNTDVTGWSTTGYNFVYTGVASATTGVSGQYGNVALWTTASFVASPNGGNFLALDGAYGQGALTQTISGFNTGDKVTINFSFAGAQQQGFDGENTEQFMVSLGGQDLYTEVLKNHSHGFTGWKSESLTFTATSSSEVLSFFAIGTPAGVPPMSLLDGVSATSNTVSAVPEPSSIALMMTGFASLGGYVRSRVKKS